MGTKIDVMVDRTSNLEDYAGRDVQVIYDSGSAVISLIQDEHVILLDPQQLKNILDLLMVSDIL